MKYEHRDYLALVAVTDMQDEPPLLLLSLNPSVFNEQELLHNQIIVRNELKRMKDAVSELNVPLAPGLHIAVLNIRQGNTSFHRFSSSLNLDIFREYKLEAERYIFGFFGMQPEPLLYVTKGEATPEYVNQDR